MCFPVKFVTFLRINILKSICKRLLLFSSIHDRNMSIIFFIYTNHDESQTKKFLYLDKTFVSCHLALFMASKTKTASFHDVIRTLFLVLLLRFWLQNHKSKSLCLVKAFVPCSFPWFMAIKFKRGVFWNLLTKMGVYLFLFMVLISKREVSITQLDVCSYCFAYSYKIHNRVLITETAMTKLLENTLDESLKRKNMSDETSLLNLNFFRAMSDLLKTLISHPEL